MYHFSKFYPYHWINSFESNAEANFTKYFYPMLKSNRIPVFLCIGTPLLSGDCLGPSIGSILKKQGIPNVYGCLESPVHAENIEFYRKLIKSRYKNTTLIAIDAALGTASQAGYITLRHGSLKPGYGIGKSIAPIGNIEITGIFENIQASNAECLSLFMSKIITTGIFNTLQCDSTI